MIEELGLSKGQAGLIAGANYFGYLAGAAVATSPRLAGNVQRWVTSSLAVSAITTGLMGSATGLTWFLLLRFVGGAASAFVLVLASALVLEQLSAAGRSNLASWHFAGVGTGVTISAVLIKFLHQFGLEWRWMWFVGGFLSLAAVPIVNALVPRVTELRHESDRVARNGARPGLVPLIIAYGLFGFGYVITATFIVAIVRDSPATRPYEYLVWLVVGLSAIPSVAVWSTLGQRFGVLLAFALACFVEAIGVFVSVLWLDLAGIMVAALFLGGTFMGITALGLIAARMLAQGNARRAVAGITAAFGVGQAIGPVAAGYAFDLTGSFLVSSVAAAFGLGIATILSLNVRRTAAMT